MDLGFTPVNHDRIDSSALKIVSKLQENGHTAYLVGGCVRDLLVGLTPKDFDISTTARPRQVKKIIKNAFIIGKRFRLVLVRRGDIQYEVSTFRRGLKPGENPEHLPDGDNIFGTPREDANRRDYTCNALFYDPVKKTVLDYTNGIRDLKSGWLKLIGAPSDRLPEDSIRILRALRFSSKLGLQIEPELHQGLHDYADELKFSHIPRRREEFLKILRLKNPSRVFLSMKDLKILDKIVPTLEALTNEKGSLFKIMSTFEELDFEHRLVLEPSELFGALLWAIAVHVNSEFSFEDYLDWVKDDSIQSFMKTELGVFIAELTHIEQAFRLVPSLQDFKSFCSKGERRQYGLLNQKAFPLALFFYAMVSGPDLGLWTDAFNGKDLSLELPFQDSDEKTDV